MTSPSRKRAPRVSVIGAGSSGLTMAKALSERGLRPMVFEMGSRVGGLWVFGNDNGRGGAYRSLHINTSRPMTEFSDFPLPRDVGDYASHEQMAKYFADYAARFDLLRLISFRTEVVRATPVAAPRPGYSLTLRDRDSGEEEERHTDALIIASGHHFEPMIPALPGLEGFRGRTFHSHAYVDPATPVRLSGQRVCVVGAGNSGADIASEAALAGASVSLCMRTPSWVLPKYLLGKPIDQGSLLPAWLPATWRRTLATVGVRLLLGKMSDFGLPDPTHRIGEAHPTLSDTLLSLTKGGKIHVRGGIRELGPRSIVFDDEKAPNPLPADVLIFATGYRVTFPFFDETHIAAPGNRLPLFGRIFHPEHRHAFFVGLAQTVGAITKTAELQARWIAEHLAGEYNLPEKAEMEELIREQERAVQMRYIASERHTMQVDPEEFRRFALAELKRGRERARLGAGSPFPSLERDH